MSGDTVRAVGAIVVGVVVGYATDNPQLGVAAAGLVYGVTAPNQKVVGPLLTDLKGPQSSYGGVIPYIEGSWRTAGAYIWSSAKRPIANDSSEGGKGGPGVDSTLYTYEMDVLIELSINELAGVLKIFSNGKLVWSADASATLSTLTASAATDSWRAIRFYDGNPAQMPDPTYEAAVGVGYAPAYRTRATIFIEGLNLGSNGQLPVLTFLVTSNKTPSSGFGPLASVPSFVGGFAGSISKGTSSLNPAGFSLMVPQWDGGYHDNTVLVYRFTDNGATVDDGTNDGAGGFSVADPFANTMPGTSDVGVFMQTPSAGKAIAWGDNGFPIGTYDMTVGAGGADQLFVFAMRGSDVLFAGADASANSRVYKPGGTYSAPLATPIQCLALSTDGYVYAAEANSPYDVLKLDVATLSLVATIPKPTSVYTGIHVCCDGSTLYLQDGGNCYRYTGSAWVDDFGPLPPEMVAASSQIDLGVFNGALYTFTETAGTPPHKTYTVWAAVPTITADAVHLDAVVSRLCLRTGLLTAGDIDVTDLADDLVTGFAVSQFAATRNAIETLMQWYQFEAYEGPKIVFRKRGKAPALTIVFDDLGVSPADPIEPVPVQRLNDIEQPSKITAKYANSLNDFQDGAESSGRLATDSTSEQLIEVTIAATPTDAKHVVDIAAMDAAVSVINIGPIAVSQKYLDLDPTDVVLVVNQAGDIYRARIIKLAYAALVLTLDLVLDDATVVNSVANTDTDYTSSTLVRTISNTTVDLMDIPILRDADDSPGIYAGFKAPAAAFRGAALYKSGDDVTFTSVLSATTRVVDGIATSILGPWDGGYVFDEVNSFSVNVGADTLSSVSRSVLLTSNANAFLIGSEIVQARDLHLDSSSPNVYTATGLLRGRRGTEWAMDSHAASERVVQLTTSIRRVLDQQADIGILKHWKAVSIGKSVASVPSVPFTDTGVSEKPFSPVRVAVNSTGVQDLTVSWLRRTRLQTRLVGAAGISAPLGEALEAYEVDVFSGSTLLRTVSSVVPTIVYTRAQQLADGVSGASSIHFVVYQMSATIGRGYGASSDVAAGTVSPLPQISAVTVGGSFASGAPLFVTLGSTRFTYTSISGDANLAGIATSLAAVVDADPNYTATASAGVVTITGAVSVAFPIVAGVDAGDNAIGWTPVQAASPIRVGVREEYNFGFLSLGGPYNAPVGSGFYLAIRRKTPGLLLSYNVFSDTTNSSYIVKALSDLQNAFVASGDGPRYDLQYTYVHGDIEAVVHTPLADPQNWDIVVATSWTGNGLTGLIGQRGSGVTPVPVATPQIVTATLTGTPHTGWVYRLTLDGTNYDYTALVTDTTMSLVATGLAAVVDAAAGYISTASAGVVTVTSATANTPFTYQAKVIVSTVTATAATTQEAA